MRRPPRRPKEPLFGRRTVAAESAAGSGRAGSSLLAVFGIASIVGLGEQEARALTFASLCHRQPGADPGQPLVVATDSGDPAIAQSGAPVGVGGAA